MAGNPRSSKARKFGSSGGGGGNLLGNILGAYFGMPNITGGGMLGGAEMAALGGPEAVIGATEPVREPLRVEKPGFWQNVLSRGAAGENYSNLNAQIKLGEYDDAMRQELVRRQILGQQGNITLKDRLEAAAAEADYKRQQEADRIAHERALIEADVGDALTRGLGRNTQLRDEHVIPDTIAKLKGSAFKQGLENAAFQRPDTQAAFDKSILASLEKPVLDNKKLQADILTSDVERPTKAFMGVGPNTKVDPVTGRAYLFTEPRDFAPAAGYEGGLKEVNMNNFLKVPGGLDGQEKVFRGVPELLKRPVETTSQPLPLFDFLSQPRMELPPQAEPYREYIESKQPQPKPEPIIPQMATPLPEAVVPQESAQDKLLRFLRRPRPGVGIMNPYIIR